MQGRQSDTKRHKMYRDDFQIMGRWYNICNHTDAAQPIGKTVPIVGICIPSESWTSSLELSHQLDLHLLLPDENNPSKFSFCFEIYSKLSNNTHLDRRVLGLPAEHDAHPGGDLLRLPRRHAVGVGPVKPGALIEQNHLLRLALGVEVSHDFEGGVALHQGDLHVEGAEIDSQDGLGKGEGGEGEEG